MSIVLAPDHGGPEAGPGDDVASAVRVVIVDDHEFFRTGVTAWMDQQPGLLPCGEAASLADARALLAGATADVLLLDLTLPDGDGLEFIQEALQLRPDLRVIVLSQRDEAVFAERAMKYGASGYVMKSEASDQLLEAIQAVTEGGTWLSRVAQAQAVPLELAARLRDESALGELSDRELQVFALIGAGHGPKEIANRLGISTKTVEAHREHIRHKLGLKTAAALTQTAQRWVTDGKV
jgi:DNA-binding NarL/FixJ family response regulator